MQWRQNTNNLIIASIAIPIIFTITGCQRDAGDASSVRKIFGETGLGPGEFSYPRAIAVSPTDGCVFVVDKTARVQRFSPDGEYQMQWRMPEYANGKPTGIYIDTKGLVWVADTHYARVIVFDREGREQFRFGSRGDGPGQFIFPTNVTLDRDGFIYVGEYGGKDRISKFSPDRKYLGCIADEKSGAGWVERPQSFVFDETGVLWVIDACHHRVCRYDKDGKFLSSFGTAGTDVGQLNYPYGLALEKKGTLLVADRCNNRLVRYQRDGKVVGTWGSPGRAPGQVQQPWAVTVGKDERIYCLDSWNNRVQVIQW